MSNQCLVCRRWSCAITFVATANGFDVKVVANGKDAEYIKTELKSRPSPLFPDVPQGVFGIKFGNDARTSGILLDACPVIYDIVRNSPDICNCHREEGLLKAA